ncbi:MAG: hypothetical protein LKF61_03220 [Eggerthellaceae bacterium]|jgi:hypothetical protein|nr:hypothetical protein [Eggerthellaceae bacterium]
MNVTESFKSFCEAIRLEESNDFDTSVENIVKKLNQHYYDSSSTNEHMLMAGSVGRGTAVSGVSDVDVIFELPGEVKKRIDGHDCNGQSDLLQEVKDILKERYPKTIVRGDGQVVSVEFTKYTVEVVPGFQNSDDSFDYPDSNDGGKWRKTDPIPEQAKAGEMNVSADGNYARLCNILRIWKDNVGFHFGGLLIDTLVCNYLNQRESSWTFGFAEFPDVLEELFLYLSKEDKEKAYWLALGSNQQIENKDGGAFVSKAKKAANKISESDPEDLEAAFDELFGSSFSENVAESSIRNRRELWRERYGYWDMSEQYIEDMFPINIKGSVSIDCEVLQDGFKPHWLREMSKRGFPLLRGRKLFFKILTTDIEAPYQIYWKVRNCGEEAYRKKMIRGQIVQDDGGHEKKEHSDFRGDHYVECYVVKDGICVARNHIGVPISAE